MKYINETSTSFLGGCTINHINNFYWLKKVFILNYGIVTLNITIT